MMVMVQVMVVVVGGIRGGDSIQTVGGNYGSMKISIFMFVCSSSNIG